MTSSAAPSAPGTTAPAPGATRRIPLWDNARYLAIFLVVAGHSLTPLRSDSDLALVAYYSIYLFHVPLFVLISGYFAKASAPTPKDLRRLITDLVLPYLIFEAIWTLFQFLVSGNASANFAKPSWTLWFLLSLVAWRLLLPYLALTRWPLTIAVVVSLLAGYTTSIGDTLSLDRTLGFLPFFVLGWKIRQWRLLDRWNDRTASTAPIRIAAAATFVATIAVVAGLLQFWRGLHLGLFVTYSDAYPEFGYPEWWAGLIRLAVMVVAALLCLALLVLVPRRQTWYSEFGQATLYIYLLHTFFLYPLRETDVLTADFSELTVLSALCAAAGVTLLLSLPIVRRIFRPVIEPKADWLLRP